VATFTDSKGTATLTSAGTGTIVEEEPGAILGDPANNSLRFPADNAWLTGGDVYRFAGTAAFAIECWIMLAALPATGFPRIVTTEFTDGGGGQGYTVYFSNTTGVCAFARNLNGGDNTVGFTTMVVGRWYHHVVSYDGALLSAYTDGVLVQTQASTFSMVDAAVNFRVGGFGAGLVSINGWLDEFAVYTSPLSAEQVLRHFRAGKHRRAYRGGTRIGSYAG
jgi:hypothetical protein